jgi:3'-phosphoadenosine 5'-phosphosulfate sulfotransferase (PAPS reductase)/FAD synthetase
MLGKKQSISNDDWITAAAHIEETMSRKELDTLVKKTIKEIKETTKGKRAAFAWSGGKDSLVLERICRSAGINDCVLVISDLEYPAFVAWVEAHKPEGLTIINTGQNLDWLVKNQKMLFPQNSMIAAQWFHIVQHRGQEKYFKDTGTNKLLLGRRRADGNYVGRGCNQYTDRKGVTRYSPLAAWSHEAILAYIHYYELPMPPIYDWHNGYLCGTHPWPARQWTGSEENGWREVYEIDYTIVEAAAELFPAAKDFLSRI